MVKCGYCENRSYFRNSSDTGATGVSMNLLKTSLFAAGALSASLAFAGGGVPAPAKPYKPAPAVPAPGAKVLNFIIMGDSGTGTDAQYRTAAGMKQVCDQKGCDMALGLGDNIYELGPWSVQDAQFQDKFEKPFANMDVPFFMVLGNHDTSGLIPGDGSVNYRGSHEVEYTKHSGKWKMPARYYTIEDSAAGAMFLGYDSNQTNAYVVPFWEPYWLPNGSYTDTQKMWIDKELKENEDKFWRFAFAHHPFRTNGHHGDDTLVQGSGPYDDLMQKHICNQVDFILAGHEHALEILAPTEGDCGRTRHLVSGAAAKSNGHKGDNTYAVEFEDYSGRNGFFHGQINARNFTLTAYTVNDAGVVEQQFQRTYTK